MKKFINDPFYQDVVDSFGETSLSAAGWIDTDPLQVPYNLDVFFTPLQKIKDNLDKNENNKPIAVLLSTGSFAPFHSGHLEMFNLSKEKLEEKGFFVAGGFFSPSHDKYVLNKYDKTITLTAPERIQIIYDQIENTIYNVDSWETLGVDLAVNFTDVYQRIKLYIKKHLDIEINLFYVFGSDNFSFHQPFIKKGNCICIERSTHIIEEIQVRENFTYIKSTNNFISSSLLRNSQKTTINEENIKPYLIREDVEISLDEKEKIKYLFEKTFNRPIIFINLQEQQNMVDQIKDDFLNFDKMTSGGIPVNISRIFNMADNQKTPESIIVEKFEVDLNKEYLIVDDDIASGKTIKLFKEKFPNIKIKGELSLAKLWYEHKFNKPYDIFDIVDLRDFIPHHKHGGLLVRNGKNIFRHPYIYPFVNLVTRMNMNPKDVMTFSKQIKEILY